MKKLQVFFATMLSLFIVTVGVRAVAVSAATTYTIRIDYLDATDPTGTTKVADSVTVAYTPPEAMVLPKAEVSGYAVAANGWDAATTKAISSGTNLATITMVYQMWYVKEAPVVEEGTYTLSQVHTNPEYHYSGITDASGKVINGAGVNNKNSAAVNWTLTIDGVQVWCYDPETSTVDGAKYESRTAQEDTYASFIATFGDGYAGVTNTLLTATTQAMLWERQGYQNVFSDYYIVENGKVRAYTAEEAATVAAVKARIAKAYEDYTNGVTAGLTLVSGDASYSDGVVTIEKGKLPSQLVFTGSKEVLAYYASGAVQYPAGVTGTIDSDAGTLTLGLSSDLSVGDYAVLMSMIRSSKQGATTEYYSNYNRQTLRDYRVADPKWETLTIKVIETPVTTTTTTTSTTTSSESSSASTSKTSSITTTAAEEQTKKVLPNTGDNLAILASLAGILLAVGAVVMTKKTRG